MCAVKISTLRKTLIVARRLPVGRLVRFIWERLSRGPILFGIWISRPRHLFVTTEMPGWPDKFRPLPSSNHEGWADCDDIFKGCVSLLGIPYNPHSGTWLAEADRQEGAD